MIPPLSRSRCGQPLRSQNQRGASPLDFMDVHFPPVALLLEIGGFISTTFVVLGAAVGWLACTIARWRRPGPDAASTIAVSVATYLIASLPARLLFGKHAADIDRVLIVSACVCGCVASLWRAKVKARRLRAAKAQATAGKRERTESSGENRQGVGDARAPQ